MPVRPGAPRVLPAARWRAEESRHHARVDSWTRAHRDRVRTGRSHPVEDFLFSYYTLRPGQLRRWHPGTGVVLTGPEAAERLSWRWYTGWPAGTGDAGTEPGVIVDAAALADRRRGAAGFIRDLLRSTAGRPAQLGCFGLHEWAMVYRQPAERRHPSWPLRLGAAGTDAVVESHRVRCTHADAFRFFTPEARPRNQVQPRRSTQLALEQPGCLHATMDLYRWAYTLAPATPSDLVADCFELAREVRAMDMRASPYDLTGLGYPPVRIETPEGKAEYAAAQREFAGRARPLRHRLEAVCDRLLEAEPARR